MKLKEIDEARCLRQQGFSIKQIAAALNVSKGSVSRWVRDIRLSKKALENIENQQRLGRERSRRTRLCNIANRDKALYNQCKSEIIPLTKRDLWIAGLMLYAGEGRKVWGGPSQPIELTNSEPAILRIFIKFLIDVCKVCKDQIKIRIFIYPDIDFKKVKHYWSKELNIPLSQFQKPQVKQSYNTPTRSRRSDYGTVHIVLSKAELYRKIMAYLRVIYKYYR